MKPSATRKSKDSPTRNSSRPGTYFQSLMLQNVRCFGEEPQALQFVDERGQLARWTILLGENGTGKTTVLQTLGLLQTKLPPLQINKDYEFINFQIPSYIVATELSKMIFTAKAVARATIRSNVALSGNIDREGETRDFEFIARGPFLGWEPSPPQEGYANCFGYGAGRRLSQSPLDGDDSFDAVRSLDAIRSLFDDHAPLRNAEDWLIRLDYSTNRASQKRKRKQQHRLDQVKTLLIGVLPDVEDIRFGSTTGPNPRPVIEFQTPYGWVPLRQLGYGYQSMIGWVVDLVSRMVETYPDSPDPLAEPAVVLVDEIDLHLHPKWQRDLISFLTERFPNTQFIATAHSPLIVQAAASVGANLAVLRREGDHVVIDNDVDSIRNWRLDQISTSKLFGLESARPPDLDRPLKRRKELLTKAKLTASEKRELAALEAEIGDLPTGETAEQAKTMTLIEDALKALEKHQETGS
ncbi:hypothetical protein BH23PLA1_BH23PLA1_19470 [soil metagenome]